MEELIGKQILEDPTTPKICSPISSKGKIAFRLHIIRYVEEFQNDLR